MNKHFAFDLKEASGALGDLGTLIPLMIAAVAIGGLSAQPVLLGFAAFFILTGFVYRLPVPVQPMKALVAVMLVMQIPAGSIALAGAIIGAVLLVLGATGWIDRLVRLVPQSVVSGLQLGLGIMLGLVAMKMLVATPVMGVLALVALAVLLRTRGPAALVFLVAALLVGWVWGTSGAVQGMQLASMPTFDGHVADLVLPQLSLTLTNAILLTAVVMHDCYRGRARGVTPRKLAITSGIANLALAPFGALPMCHGAGGAAAHHRFGARTGGAPLMLGLALAAIALVPGGFDILMLIPAFALGAMLLVASVDLAWSRRLTDAVPSCRPVIVLTALGVVAWNPLLGLVLGTLAEIVRKAVVRKLYGGRRRLVA